MLAHNFGASWFGDNAIDRPRWFLSCFREPRLFSALLGPTGISIMHPRADKPSRKGPRGCFGCWIPSNDAVYGKRWCRWRCKTLCVVLTMSCFALLFILLFHVFRSTICTHWPYSDHDHWIHVQCTVHNILHIPAVTYSHRAIIWTTEYWLSLSLIIGQKKIKATKL